MSAILPKKRRKLNASPTKAPLSAFAARKAQERPEIVEGGQNEDHIPLTTESKCSNLSIASAGQVGSNVLRERDLPPDIKTTSDVNDTPPILEDGNLLSIGSRGQSPESSLPERPSITLSNFKPNKENARSLSGGSIVLFLAPGERLVILGQYEISVRKGQVTLMGATLAPSKATYVVSASSSHALPVIRCSATDINGAELRLRSCDNGLRSLSNLSPLYGRLWNDQCGPLGSDYEELLGKTEKTSFQILFSSKDAPSKTFLQPLVSPALWNEMMARCSTLSSDETPRIVMICGPKSSGKSTFAKLLVNRLLSTTAEADFGMKTAKSSGVAILDIDPGQPEYCPPGQLALVQIREPNFGPPYAHPVPGSRSKILRSHSIGAISPAIDPELFMACILDLFANYQNLLSKSPSCPLVINTPGWVLGTGLEILVGLIRKVRPTEIIYMSKDGPPEVVESLAEAAAPLSVLTLPSQSSEYTTRTAAHLRTMQYMSYFHLKPEIEKSLSWDHQPLTSMLPWEIKYSGDKPGILGVMCYAEQPPARLLTATLNGSLVSVVVIDDMTAIPGWGMEEKNTMANDPKAQLERLNSTHLSKDLTSLEIDEHSQVFQLPLILQTPEGIPYFNPTNSITLDPRNSHSIGLALVRGIDIERQRIQVLTPIPSQTIERINSSGKSIVLVSGKLDTPGWAYIEELTQKTALDKVKAKTGVDIQDTDDESSNMEDLEEEEAKQQRNLGDGFSEAPWIERLQGSQGRGVGSRVWRVRRDLGKADD